MGDRIANVRHRIKDVEHHTANVSDRIANVRHCIKDVEHHTANVSDRIVVVSDRIILEEGSKISPFY